MNVHNFKRVMRAIAAAPEWKHFMMAWHIQTELPHCGTAHCIAGWCEVLTNGEEGISLNANDTRERAIQFLGLKTNDEADRLFAKDCWPEEFQRQYQEGPKSKAMVARLAHFIKTEGRE